MRLRSASLLLCLPFCVTLVPSASATLLRCLLPLFVFDFYDYDSYPRWFSNESEMILAQAGVYTGPDDIAEYLRFATRDSPFVLSGPNNFGFKIKYTGYNRRTGECSLLYASKDEFLLDPSTTASEAAFNNTSLTKIFYNLRGRFFPRMYVYYPVGFLNLTFGTLLRSDNTRDYICGLLEGPCTEWLGDPAVDCRSRLAALDSARGEEAYVDSNTQGCRALHAALTSFRPNAHCPHLALDPTADPQGRIKCQDYDGDPLSVASLFTERDLQFFRDYSWRVGIDPEIGHDADVE